MCVHAPFGLFFGWDCCLVSEGLTLTLAGMDTGTDGSIASNKYEVDHYRRHHFEFIKLHIRIR